MLDATVATARQHPKRVKRRRQRRHGKRKDLQHEQHHGLLMRRATFAQSDEEELHEFAYCSSAASCTAKSGANSGETGSLNGTSVTLP